MINNDLGINLVLYAIGNTISENTVTNNDEGIHLTTYSSNNTISRNLVTNNQYGIYLSHSKGNTITGNTLAQNGRGVYLYNTLSTQNIIRHNVIADNEYGIHVAYPSNSNVVYLNNFIQNTNQVYFDSPTLTFTWDNGAAGNYWSDYSGSDANEDGIGETPYVINVENEDNYPFMKMWGWDTTNPSVTIISPTEGSEIGAPTIGATWIGFDDISGISHYEIQLDDNSWINVGPNPMYTFTEVKDGNHAIKVKAVDKAGNSNLISVSFTVNTGHIEDSTYIKEAVLLAVGVVVVTGVVVYLLKIKRKVRIG